ncbi:MAG: flagellar motor protein MotD [Nitrosomonas sp.]|nr:flagellar motor protein MotD [Nitrosomonas sp.]MDP1950034.1 flagellar motor protein MotD [Nitrosomonas sp.]
MRRRRKFRHREEPDHHDRWLVSYADFITLLFAFFVVMYAISSVNEGKYKVLGHSLVNAFGSHSSSPGQFATHDLSSTMIPLPILREPEPEADEQAKKKDAQQKEMRRMATDIMQALAPLVQNGKVSVTQSAQGITVEINASVLFSPAQAQLAESSSLTLRAIAEVVKGHTHEIRVEGHTDDLPINTLSYPSNWELSTARASSVIRLFIDNGVDTSRLTALGYGENRPVALNNTPEGRARNRRVTIMIMSLEPEQMIELPIDFISAEPG